MIWAWLLKTAVGRIAGGVMAALLIGGFFYGVHRIKGCVLAEHQAKAVEKVRETTEEVQDDRKEREEKVDRMSPDDLVDYWGGVRRQPNSGGGPAAAPGQAGPGKPVPGQKR